MKEITGSTSEEKKMIKAIQRKLGALDNGVVGNQTMSDIAIAVGADCFPLNVELYSQPCIIAKDADPLNPNGALPTNAISGSFSWQGQPCSILVRDGKVIRSTSCHYPTPESVLYKTKDGKVHIERTANVNDGKFPISKVEWAVGGLGLLGMYNPSAEGFSGAYADVLRKTNHTVLGYRGGMFYGIYCKNMTAAQVNTLMKNSMKLDMAVMLDGGHVAAISGTDNKINTAQKQYYAVKLV